ncbi:hypothetical protein R1flu_009872 [Riccia fluitans]|uniref:Secreted protein n=1 Tax=Riccia fluitans TaxID=41844 RepID=A0ABD1Z3D3_9MARC
MTGIHASACFYCTALSHCDVVFLLAAASSEYPASWLIRIHRPLQAAPLGLSLPLIHCIRRKQDGKFCQLRKRRLHICVFGWVGGKARSQTFWPDLVEQD